MRSSRCCHPAIYDISPYQGSDVLGIETSFDLIEQSLAVLNAVSTSAIGQPVHLSWCWDIPQNPHIRGRCWHPQPGVLSNLPTATVLDLESLS